MKHAELLVVKRFANNALQALPSWLLLQTSSDVRCNIKAFLHARIWCNFSIISPQQFHQLVKNDRTLLAKVEWTAFIGRIEKINFIIIV